MGQQTKQSRLSGSFALMTAQAVVLFLGYITHVLIGRFLGPASYGIYGIVLSVQTTFGIILTLGVPSAVARFVSQDEEYAKSILRHALKVQTITAVLLAVFMIPTAYIISTILQDITLTPYLLFISVVIFLQSFYPIYAQYLSGMHQFSKQAMLTAVYAVAKLTGALSLLFILGVFGAFAGFAIGGVVAAVVGWHFTKFVGGTKEKTMLLSNFLAFAGVYVVTLAGLQLLMSIDLFMVKTLLKDDVQTGMYNAASTLARISYMLLQSITFVLLPSVSALTKPGASHEKAVKFIKETLRYLIALIVPGVAIAASTSKQMLTLFFSTSYINAAPALTVLMIGIGMLSFYLLLSSIAAGAGRAGVGLFITIMMMMLSGTLGTFLIPEYGLIGAALQTTLSAAFGLLILVSYTLVIFKIVFPVVSTLNILIASSIAVLPTYVWDVPTLLLPAQYITLFGIYIGVLALLHEITNRDRLLIASSHPALAWMAPKHP